MGLVSHGQCLVFPSSANKNGENLPDDVMILLWVDAHLGAHMIFPLYPFPSTAPHSPCNLYSILLFLHFVFVILSFTFILFNPPPHLSHSQFLQSCSERDCSTYSTCIDCLFSISDGNSLNSRVCAVNLTFSCLVRICTC